MRPYEVVVIFDAELEESAIQAVVNRATELLQGGGGSVERVDKWGRRRFAYEVSHRSEGFYVLLEVSANPPAIEELARFLRLADGVVRHRVIRVPGETGQVLDPSVVDELVAPGRRPRNS